MHRCRATGLGSVARLELLELPRASSPSTRGVLAASPSMLVLVSLAVDVYPSGTPSYVGVGGCLGTGDGGAL